MLLDGDQRLDTRNPPPDLQAAATAVLASAAFSRAPRLREFLAFVVRCSVENRAHEVNEYSIGVQVFGKRPDYNPNLDNIVRVTARQLRSKLTEYYATEGCHETWRLEMPKGCYHVGLIPNLPTLPAPSERPGLPRWAPWLAAFAAAGWALALWAWISARPSPPQPAYLLAPILTDRARPLTIVLDDPIFVRTWLRIGEQLGIQGFASGRYLDAQHYSTEAERTLHNAMESNQYASMASLQTMLQLTGIARSHGVASSTLNCRSLRAGQMEQGNLVFIGGVGSNPWVSEIQKDLAFEHRTTLVPTPRRYFINRKPKPGEPALFENTDRNPDEHYFTRVALLKNPFGSGQVALLGGTSRDATEAAGQFALSQSGVDQISRLCGAPAHRLAGFEVILGTKSVGGTHLRHSILASRCR